MSTDAASELYQQMILEHNKKPRNFGPLPDATHKAEGFNPVCGDHFMVYLKVDAQGQIEAVQFEGSGCAISKASASIMTTSVKGKNAQYSLDLFEEFHKLLVGAGTSDSNVLGKLGVFSGIWKFPARVKCASLSWHTLKAALTGTQKISTE